ncbi:hypothetical protein [Jiangella gansuensis]|uniref:hypothetical protein n=1 Tax=Jiangella gansuensis TaxID=281473 RepID=UPI00047EAF26|nr:hypothetical protein [Jiangella gansuensis]
MVTVPEPDKRQIIARAPFFDESVGEMVAHLLHGNAEIDVVVKPFESEQIAGFAVNVKEARRFARVLLEFADVAQAAMWTPKLLAEVRNRWLPGATDAEIIQRLNDLCERRGGGIELLSSGRLFAQDGEALVAAVHREKVDRVAVALSDARVSLTDLDSVVADLRTIYSDTSQG